MSEAHRAKVFAIFGKQRQLSRSPKDGPLDFRAHIEPKMARDLLDVHESLQAQASHKLNRNLKPAAVDRYAMEMASSTWMGFSSASIAFGPSGRCIDGRHRLSATVQSGRDWPGVLVCLDTNEDTILVIDNNSTRTDVDAIHTAGLHFGATAAHVSTAKFMEAQNCRQPMGGRKISRAELDRRLTKYMLGIDFAIASFRNRQVNKVTIAPVISAIAKAYYAVDEASKDRLFRFGDVLTSLPNEPGEHAAAAFARSLISNDPCHSGQERQHVHLRAQMAVRHFMACEPRSIIRLPSAEPYPLEN